MFPRLLYLGNDELRRRRNIASDLMGNRKPAPPRATQASSTPKRSSYLFIGAGLVAAVGVTARAWLSLVRSAPSPASDGASEVAAATFGAASDNASEAAAAVFSRVLIGQCEETTVSELDLREVAMADGRPLGASRSGFGLPEHLRCPLVLRGAVAWSGATSLADRWSWTRIRRAGPQKVVTFDASPVSEFTYWSNGSRLAEVVRSAGVRRQGYTKRTASAAHFVDATAAVLTDVSEFGRWVRYGDTLERFSRGMAAELASAAADGDVGVELMRGAAGPLTRVAPRAAPWGASDRGEHIISLFLAAPGVTSTAHFDNFANTHVLLRGRKTITLAPPPTAHAAGPFAEGAPLHSSLVWPSAHPHDRQLRRTDISEHASAATIELQAGDALFIPSGWVHQVTALERSFALSLTVLGHEYGDFLAWTCATRESNARTARDLPVALAGLCRSHATLDFPPRSRPQRSRAAALAAALPRRPRGDRPHPRRPAYRRF